MCLILFRQLDHPRYKLIVAANRDESHNRPAAPADFWEDSPSILAGRDLLAQGTWLGITASGRFAALTNYRSPEHMEAGAVSRGAIVRDFLAGNQTPEAYTASLDPEQYAGFNLLFGTPDQLFYFNNFAGTFSSVSPGTHGLSNAALNTPWPKVEKGKRMLADYTSSSADPEAEVLMELLADAEYAQDRHLPDSGVGLELERSLSPMFIRMDGYGTRCSTVLLIGHDNSVHFVERTYSEEGTHSDRRFDFRIHP